MTTIIDTHAHLYDLTDPVAVLRDCAAAGVSDVIALGVDLESNRRHLEIIRHQPQDPKETSVSSKIHLGLGLHPGNIISLNDTEACFAFMREHINDARAIGETGLDFWYKWVRKDNEKKREQCEVFARHLDLAREFDLPVVVHSRGAWTRCLEMVCSSGVRKAEFHWYSGPADVLEKILEAGFCISVTPALAYSPELRRAAEIAPLERILIETDTPVGYPDEARDKRRESRDEKPEARGERIPSTPRDVWRTLKLLAAVKGLPEAEVLAVVNRNAREFFGLSARNDTEER